MKLENRKICISKLILPYMNNKGYISKRSQKRLDGYKRIILDAYNSSSGMLFPAKDLGEDEANFVLAEAMQKGDERIGRIALEYMLLKDREQKALHFRDPRTIAA